MRGGEGEGGCERRGGGGEEEVRGGEGEDGDERRVRGWMWVRGEEGGWG